jgi:hypothetical protein
MISGFEEALYYMILDDSLTNKIIQKIHTHKLQISINRCIQNKKFNLIKILHDTYGYNFNETHFNKLIDNIESTVICSNDILLLEYFTSAGCICDANKLTNLISNLNINKEHSINILNTLIKQLDEKMWRRVLYRCSDKSRIELTNYIKVNYVDKYNIINNWKYSILGLK